MTRIGRRLIEDFLLPALNDERYGDLLKWIDRDKRYFCIRWSHKNAAKWTLSDTAVFQDWDRLKGHYHPEIKGYYMQAKQRFRAALYKLSSVRKVHCDDKHVKKYQLMLDIDKKQEIMPRKGYRHKEENQKSIPTPVICRNTSFVAKACAREDLNSLPASPDSFKSEVSDKINEMEMCVEEYQQALKNQRKRNHSTYSSRTIKTEVSDDCPAGVLRESPQVNVNKNPHVPIQPVPVYSHRCAFRLALENSQKDQPVEVSIKQQAADNSQKRVESPHLLLVPTYNDPLELNAISVLSHGIGNRNHYPIIPVYSTEINQSAVDLQNLATESCNALNLSIKCEDKATLCR